MRTWSRTGGVSPQIVGFPGLLTDSFARQPDHTGAGGDRARLRPSPRSYRRRASAALGLASLAALALAALAAAHAARELAGGAGLGRRLGIRRGRRGRRRRPEPD